MFSAYKWLTVARNEYRIHTSRIRSIRPAFPYLVTGLLVIYVGFIAPRLVGLFIDEFRAFILSKVAVALVQILLFMIFFYFIILPITSTLKDVQTGPLELFLAAPIKPSDVLLGEFLGVMPFYAIAITVIAGLFTAALNPLHLDLAQIAIIVIIFIVTFFSALWIGTVIAVILRTKLGKSTRSKDIGRALALVLALPMIAMIWAISGGGLLEALADPGKSGMVKALLGVLPSSWGAEVIVGFAANPGNIGAVGFETLTRFGGLITFFIAALLLGTKAASLAYSMKPTTFIASRAKPDGVFYKTVKYLGGSGSFGTLLVSVFKDYSRRLENISKLFLVGAILVMINIFLDPEIPEGPLEVAPLILPTLAAFVVGDVTLHGKECLFIYRKTPSGVGRFVIARLLHGWLIVVPIAAVVTAFSTILIPKSTLVSLLTNTGIVMLTVAAYVAFTLGLCLLNPAFSDKSGNYVTNLMITIFTIPNGLFLVPLIAFELGFLHTLCYVTIPLCWLLGIVFLYLGKRKLSRIE